MSRGKGGWIMVIACILLALLFEYSEGCVNRRLRSEVRLHVASKGAKTRTLRAASTS